MKFYFMLSLVLFYSNCAFADLRASIHEECKNFLNKSEFDFESCDARLVKLAGKAVVREGGTLSFMKNGKAFVSFENYERQGDASKKHHLRNIFPEISMYYVATSLWEGSDHVLIDCSHEKTYLLEGGPVWSKSKERFACATVDLVAGYNTNAGTIWRCNSKSGCAREFDVLGAIKSANLDKQKDNKDPDDQGMEVVKWVDDREVIFNLLRSVEGSYKPTITPVNCKFEKKWSCKTGEPLSSKDQK